MWSLIGINRDIHASYILQSQILGLKKIVNHTLKSRIAQLVWNEYCSGGWEKEIKKMFLLLCIPSPPIFSFQYFGGCMATISLFFFFSMLLHILEEQSFISS